jgi:myo-inositol-hexaphosphate 3-phosphohydrolase
MAIDPRLEPKDGYLYVSSGGQIKSDSMWLNRTWYAFDTVTKTVKDSIVWTGASSSFDNVRPRASAFSPGGDTAYVGAFSVVANSGLVVFVREQVTVGVDLVTDNLPAGFKLEQNFPNPFNPSTEIRFSVPEAGMTRVVVYDLLGREVEVLVNEYLNAGDYRTTFTADGLSSGTYVYMMTSGTARMTKKMVLMK